MVTAHGQALSSLPTYTLSLMLSVIELCKTPHQCGVCIGLYTLSSRRGLRMGYRIAKGVSERCVSRLLLALEVFVASEIDQKLHGTARQGIISLLDKPRQDLLSLENWRPLTMLNCNYKIYVNYWQTG